MNKKCFVLSIFFLLLTACGAQHQQNLDNVDTTNLAELERVQYQIRTPSESKTDMGALRAKALEDSSLSIGAQGGLSWASDQINVRMSQDKKYLDSIFNFNAMVLSHGVIPPVLEEGDNSLNLDDPNTIRIADRTYKIVKQAQFAPTPPNWREYLWLSYSKLQLPDKTLLPRNTEEQRIWRKAYG